MNVCKKQKVKHHPCDDLSIFWRGRTSGSLVQRPWGMGTWLVKVLGSAQQGLPHIARHVVNTRF